MWPRGPTRWIANRVLCVSIPFTWNLPQVYSELQQMPFGWDSAVVGGPAVELFPGYFDDLDRVEVGHSCPGVLQRINPLATRTTIGCVNKCAFCAVPKVEGEFRELPDWPDLPIVCDNNLLAASVWHFDKVMDRLEHHKDVDFNQGLDYRLLTGYHAERLRRLNKPIIRLACDSRSDIPGWVDAYELLRSKGIPISWIRSFVLIGYNTGPVECWDRCLQVDKYVRLVCPMWFHGLDCMGHNTVTETQAAHGWNKQEQRDILGYFYQHRGRAKYT